MKQLYIVFQRIMPRHLIVAKILPFKAVMLSRIITFASITAFLCLALSQETLAQELPVADDLVLHLDASVVVLVHESNRVSGWTDLSGIGNDATQENGDNQPIFIEDGLNGLPVVRFDGSNDYLETADFSPALSQPNTVFVVWKSNTTSTRFAIDGNTDNGRNAIFQRSGEIAFFAGSSVEYTRSTPFDWLITSALFNGSYSEIWENGISMATGNTGSNSLTGVIIGSRFEYFHNLDGYIAEIIIYNSALTDDKRKEVEYYLGQKYGFCVSPAPVLDGLVLHLDASALKLEHEEKVRVWDDLSGNNHDALQESEGSRPQFIEGGLNGKSVVKFEGNEWLETGTFNQALSQPNTAFVVWKTTAIGTQFAFDGITSTNRHAIFQGTGGGANMAFFAGTIQSYNRDIPFEWLISTALFSGANSELWENGESKLDGVNTGNHSLTGLAVGRRQGSATLLLNGEIAEILIYNRALSDNERGLVELYLSAKYGFMPVWTGEQNDVWNNKDNWLPAIVPGVDDDVLIPAGLETNYPVVNTGVGVKSIIIEHGAELTIDTGGDLTVTGSILLDGLLVNSDGLKISEDAVLIVRPTGTLYLNTGSAFNSANDAGRLIVQSNASGTGSVITDISEVNGTIQRYATGGGWHIISAPVSGQNILDFMEATDNNILRNTGVTPNQFAMTEYLENRGVDPPSGGWGSYFNENTEGPLVPGKGYLTGRSSTGPFVFSGHLEGSGEVTIGISHTANGWNAIGNPFPSAIRVKGEGSEQDFLSVNKDELYPKYKAIYIYDPASGGYITINGVSTGNSSIDQNYIQSGQGFIVKSKEEGGNISFTTGMRYHENETTFFKKSSQEPWPFIQLEVYFQNRIATTLVAFNHGMTKGLDPGYDAGQYGADPGFRLYTRLLEDDNEVNFSIQALPLDGLEDLVIPVGFDFAEGGEITFSADKLRLPPGAEAILEDRELGIFTKLINENYYKVTLDENSTGSGRFFLHTDIQITSVEDIIEEIAETEKDVLQIYSYGKEVFIKGEVRDNSFATLYDLTGRQVKTQRLMSSERNSFRVDELDRGVYIVRVSGAGLNNTARIFIE